MNCNLSKVIPFLQSQKFLASSKPHLLPLVNKSINYKASNILKRVVGIQKAKMNDVKFRWNIKSNYQLDLSIINYLIDDHLCSYAFLSLTGISTDTNVSIHTNI